MRNKKQLNPFVARRKRDKVMTLPASKFDQGEHLIAPIKQLGETEENYSLKMLDAITEREEECLKTIHTRYCIIKMIPISITDLGCFTPDKRLRPTYREYWYKWQTSKQAFLMSRETFIDDNGHVKLRIIFNKDIARAGENDISAS